MYRGTFCLTTTVIMTVTIIRSLHFLTKLLQYQWHFLLSELNETRTFYKEYNSVGLVENQTKCKEEYSVLRTETKSNKFNGVWCIFLAVSYFFVTDSLEIFVQSRSMNFTPIFVLGENVPLYFFQSYSVLAYVNILVS